MTADLKSEEPQVEELPSVAVDNPEEPRSEEPDVDKDKDEPAAAITKSSSFKEESNFLSDLTDHERKALTDLKSKLHDAIFDDKKEATEEISIWGVPLSTDTTTTDVILLKFLRAREFKVKEALEMLKRTLQWRKLSRIDSILEEGGLSDEFAAASFMDGVDREGHPICYNVTGVFRDEVMYRKAFGSPEGRDRFLRWRVFLMEQGARKLDFTPGGASSLLQITDLKNSPGVMKKELRSTMRHAVEVLQDNYPEFVARNIIINASVWYCAINAIVSPFITQRTKSKMVIVRPAKVTETLLKYIPAEAIPVQYGGLKRDSDAEFSAEDGSVELTVKGVSTATVEIPAPEAGSTLVWDLIVLGWDVNYKEEFVPTDEGSYTVIVQKGKRMGAQEEAVRNTFTNNEPGTIILSIENKGLKKKKVLYRYKTKSSKE